MLNERNTLLEDDGIEEEILVEEECSVAQAVWGDIQGNIENQTDLQNALDAKQDSLTEAQLNAVNSGITSEKVTTYDGYADQIARKADQSALNAESITRGEADTALGRRIDNEALARQSADNGLQTQIDAITSKSDVVDVVANYAALHAYDTSTLGNNDVVKVLDDETHEDALTYYRWSTTTQTWTYIGQEAPYYSKGQMDVKLAEKQDKLTAGANIQIQNGTISATDTKYTNGNGLNLNGTEFSADTDVLATKEDLEGYYTKPETDNLLAPKLEAEVVAELPTTGAEGKLYLTPKAHTTQTATGNPIEATVTEQAGQLESFQLDGDTFQQTYTGKNLLMNKESAQEKTGITITPNSDGSFTLNGAATTTTDFYFVGSWQNRTISYLDMPSGDYTISLLDSNKQQIASPKFRVELYDRMGEKSSRILWLQQGLASPQTTNVASYAQVTAYYISIQNGTSFSNEKFYIQLETGSTATSFEPFVGGQASPNPDYPQQIQTVTGTQTISINGTNYPISLGSLELCKLGTYQDYIYKSGDDWKVHKATGKYAFDGSEDWFKSGSSTSDYLYAALAITDLGIAYVDRASALMDEFSFMPTTAGDRNSGRFNLYNGTTVVQNMTCSMSTSVTSTPEEFKTWLSTHPATLYYPLYIATDTTITDTNLIAQLEAVRTASLENGTNTITNTATGTNLAGDMEISYYGYNPTNRYDKFIWLNLNNNYEQIGGE